MVVKNVIKIISLVSELDVLKVFQHVHVVFLLPLLVRLADSSIHFIQCTLKHSCEDLAGVIDFFL